MRLSRPIDYPGGRYKGQCTWYCYYRAYEKFKSYPVYHSRVKRQAGWTHAYLWLSNYTDEWEPKPATYEPVAGDIVVFDGKYGHVAFIEAVDKYKRLAIVSHYNMDVKQEFSRCIWLIGTRIDETQGDMVSLKKYKYHTGQVLGYLHYKGD